MEEVTRVDGKMGWLWRKGVSVGKKVLAACFLVFSAPFLVPALVVASTIALISSLPYCFFLVSYVCTEKLMRKLLPANAFSGRCDHEMVLHQNKISHGDIYDEAVARVAISEPVLVQIEEETTIAIAYREDEDMTKELKSWLESIRDEGKNNQSLYRGVILEKGFEEEDKDQSIVPRDAKSENVRAKLEDLLGKKQESVTIHEGELESTTSKTSREKDMEISSTTVLYSEEQIWTKIEALRKVVGYNVTRSTTYSEELKALYMFTGVELPTSTLENQDIAKVSEGLSFLMSVIGIK
ncbi:hypothetical protein AtNW77_Chr5g0117741 [Arabidopsis thaliana]|uniref:Transmembrane protein n=3 Tax=Arabidopsis TaxID=3701 RepID=A0A178U9L0_ARATH|nr:uncharacterized protein AT5G36100 [Arabidopsis thaliana]AED94043.1 transmembrane protein [Arabidopsis thaliana]KAG7603989.1 hypothetical protein ISN45_At05g030750 [Arabidopsis thaliana x Arabidopsis arenosa]OAO89827.1 hypothetical protein AXX17_AT5G33450 [Arabidopsis thaliana]CAA0405709.1 unnamed protein product [Arabidopsis thaliana]|eukprot:NP_198459.4 transmembrane protein [Arabidopsis thaliana]